MTASKFVTGTAWAATFFLASCAPPPSSGVPQTSAQAERHGQDRSVVLVAIDGVRWQEVFDGVDPELAGRYAIPTEDRVDGATLMPEIYRLMTESGAAIGGPGAGAPMEASGPNFISLPGYMEMLTGRSDTGCTTNQCDRVPFATVADDVTRASLGTAAVITSWEGIDLAASTDSDRVLVSAGRHGGTHREGFQGAPRTEALIEEAERVGPEPGNDDFRPDSLTAGIALEFLNAAKPKFLFVGLGETDEYGHRNDYRGYLNALRRADAEVGKLAEAAFELTASGHPTTLIITTDHGRERAFISHGREHPESSRVWLVAAGADIEARGRVASTRSRRLADVSQTIRQVMGIASVKGARAGSVLTELFARTSTDTWRP